MSSDKPREPKRQPQRQPKIVVKGEIDSEPERKAKRGGKKGRHTMVAAIFDDPSKVRDALYRLEAEGFPRESISVLASRETHGKHFEVVERTKAPEGAALGGLTGAILGAVAAAMVLPGLGAIAIGPVLAAFAGAGAGATTGGLVGGLVGRGIPEHEAKLLDEHVHKGGILLGVDTRGEELARKAAGNLEAAGAIEVTAH